ncbi:hypothetical protein AOQ84DRAFT_164963 [Glonium stellatum]|uniref:Uncharacterized protein n=1 Tax=Glonium stellatum TaxID=574774 RepID=A0A8E2JMT5_9PEZI|nr:hypothetical protein AOQ84DRAFT_164963 [Glonium stellatum]
MLYHRFALASCCQLHIALIFETAISDRQPNCSEPILVAAIVILPVFLRASAATPALDRGTLVTILPLTGGRLCISLAKPLTILHLPSFNYHGTHQCRTPSGSYQEELRASVRMLRRSLTSLTSNGLQWIEAS